MMDETEIRELLTLHENELQVEIERQKREKTVFNTHKDVLLGQIRLLKLILQED